MKRTRLILALMLLLPVMLSGWLMLTQSGMLWIYQQAEFYLPLELNINKIEGRLIGPITVSGIEYQQDGTVIKAEQVIIDWRPADLMIANINIHQLHIRSLSIDLPGSEETVQVQSQPSAMTLPEINLPWRLILEDGLIDGLSITRDEQTFNFNKVKLDATTLFSRISIKELAVSADAFSFDIRGSIQPTQDYTHDLKIRWQTRLPSAAILNGYGQIKGDMKSTVLQQQLTGPLQLTFDGEINHLLDQLNWQAKIDATKFDISQLDASWPAFSGSAKLNTEGDLKTASLSGTLKGKYPELGGDLDADFDLQRLSDNTININQLKIHLPQNDTILDARGSWLPAKNGGDVDLALNWQNLRWPLEPQALLQDQPWFSSASGSGTIKGNIDLYEIDLTTDSPWPQYLASTWHASATGNAEGMNIKTLHIDAMKGEAIATGQLKWTPQLSWKADISTAGIDPASLWPQWPGQLNAKISSNGRIENGQLIAEADIQQIKGKLRKNPVSLHSRLRWQNNTLDISQLEFHSGKSQVKLDGQVGETMKLNWVVDSSNLAELYPLARGKLQASGRVSGPQQTPFIEATFNGQTLSYLQYDIAAVEGTMAVDLFHWQKIDIRLTAQSLNLNEFKLQSLAINADSQQLEARAVSKKVTAGLNLKGQAVATGWRGHIEQINVQSEYFDNWQLDSPVALDISDKSLTAETLCLHNDREASICASVNGKDHAWRSRIDMNKLPLKLLSRWLPSELKLEGVANGSAEARLQSTAQLPGQLLAKVNIDLPSSAIVYPMLDAEIDRREYRSGKIQLTLDAQELNASAELTMANEDHLYARVELPEFNPLLEVRPEQPVKASARLDIRDLKMIESIVDEIHELQGELKLNLKAAGTLDHPLLSGSAVLSNGSLQIPRLGLDIEQLTLNSQSDGHEKLSFHLGARSGGGKIAVDGSTRLDRNAGWPTEISIKGDSFEASSIPEARVMVSPDLLIKLKNRNIDINGSIHIPYAKLQPKDVTRAETVSSDSVIIGGEQPPEEKWLITTSVRLTLGDRVHFYGFGFEGRLGGSLLLEDKPGQLTRATGQITIPEGVYQAYGQRLNVENGRILYTGGPLTNPGLDIRAVRKVDEVTAGILVKGTLNQPQLDIFSTPAMSQTDALSYIILGRPLDSASSEDGNMMAKAALALGLTGGDTIARSLGDRFGLDEMRVDSSGKGDQAALVVGRYLSPKLYASYGIGLIDTVNTLTLRYQLSSKWQIKAESGEAQGADILYTIDR